MGKAKNIPAKTLLLPYQKAWVEDDSRLKIAEKSRQIGWTWATAYGLVRRKALTDARLDAWISSRDDIQARLFLEDCKSFAGLLQLGASDLGERAIDDSGHSAYVLAMANGLRLHSMSSNPDAQAGKRGDRVLDEFALHPDPRKLYSIAYPGITWGGALEIFSTHRGTQNYFASLIDEIRNKGNPKNFSLHRVTLQDALDQGFLYKLQLKLPREDRRQKMDEGDYYDYIKAGCADEESFLQEYMCQPSDDNSAFITYDLLDGCKHASGADWETVGTGPLYLGVDIGRVHDLTVFWLVEDVGGVLMTREVRTLQNETFDAQEKVFCEMMDTLGVRRACIDNTGIGRQFAERGQTRYKSRVEPVTFTSQVKESLAYPLKAAMEDRTFRIPDDRAIFADFRAIRKTTTSAGNIRFDGERTKAGHSDRFWAAALAKMAATTQHDPSFMPITFRAASRPDNRRLTYA